MVVLVARGRGDDAVTGRDARWRSGRVAVEVAALAQVAGVVRGDDVAPTCHWHLDTIRAAGTQELDAVGDLAAAEWAGWADGLAASGAGG